MAVLGFLIPVSLALGALGLCAFIWSLKRQQYDDPAGDAQRILQQDWDERPKPRNARD
ncbi:cbb3-type cytochrome oxidase assembly protein CcoS [Paracoccus cavernae]|uniref:cbb3-type cytochrome oxidase assembly protein CcoS n=1 Tax=Paracoccus cavernae TaxID=1571207 RepID=UPI0035F4DA5B